MDYKHDNFSIMIKSLAFVFFVVVQSHTANSQTSSPTTLKTNIDGVTVFLSGAQVSRSGKVDIAKGKSTITVAGLSPYIDDKSVQIKALGAFTITAVKHKLNYLDGLKKDERITELREKIKKFDLEIATSESRLEILKEKQSLLDKNKDLSSGNSSISLAQLKLAIDFYDRELSTIKAEEINTRLKITASREAKSKLEQEINETYNKKDLPSGEIEIIVEADAKTTGDFSISYIVANAGWFPRYDVRVANIEKPISLAYKADVHQNTGVNWDNVKLKLSNGQPNESGVAPELETWYLDYERNKRYSYKKADAIKSVSGRVTGENGVPLAGASILVKNKTIGTITDQNGMYSLTLPNGATTLLVSYIGYSQQEQNIYSSNMNISLQPDYQALEEMVVTGRAMSKQNKTMAYANMDMEALPQQAQTLETAIIENQTTVEFEVEKPYSVKSNGDKLTVDLKKYEIETIYEYHAAPKVEKDAFLMARIINWDQYNLLEGEANLYFEDAYVGRTILNGTSLEDTLNISLGRDKSIVITRTKVETYSKRRTIGSNKIETREFEIVARNKKSQPIKLMIYDQIPISPRGEIAITAGELSKGSLNATTGIVTWELNLKPQEQSMIKLGYEVKYPKNEKLVIE
jgi:hypothetical protein